MRRATLGELVVETGGSIKTGPFGTALKAGEYTASGVPLISVGEVGNGQIRLHNKTPRVGLDVVRRLPEYVLRPGDIVFARKGAVERSAFVAEHEDGYFLGSDGIRVRFGDGVSSSFVSYQLQSSLVRDWLTQHAAGTTMASLNQSILERVPLHVPMESEQRAIAEVLGALDDKIAANDRLSDLTKSLLIAKFEALGLDELPVTVDEAVQLQELIELNPRCKVATGQSAPYLEMKNLPDRSMTASQWSYRSPQGGARFQNGDTLLARITPCLENGKVGYVDFLGADEVGVGSTEFIVMRARVDVPAALPYFLATSARFREFAIRHMAGTTGRQRLAASDLAGYLLTRVRASGLVEFGRSSEDLLDRVKAAVDENRSLANVRDELLPSLMSGKVRVNDAEKIVEEVT